MRYEVYTTKEFGPNATPMLIAIVNDDLLKAKTIMLEELRSGYVAETWLVSVYNGKRSIGRRYDAEEIGDLDQSIKHWKISVDNKGRV